MIEIRPRSLAITVALCAGASTVAWAADPNCCCTAHASPSCSDTGCSATVCGFDPYCCNVMWDSICASEAASACGAAAPYCIDGNQNGTPDVCDAGGGGGGGGGGNTGSDCDGDGLPDTQRNGPSGKSSWVGPTSGFQSFEPDANWSLGRPGALTFAEVVVPYSQYYNSLQIKANCDNAVRALEIGDSGTSSLHDLTFDLNMRTMRFAGPAAQAVLVSPNIYDTLRLEFRNGTIDGSAGDFAVKSTGALQLTFGNVDLSAPSFSWRTASSWSADPLLLQDSFFSIGAWNWPVSNTGAPVYANLRLSRSKLIFNGQGGAVFTVPDQALLTVESPTPSEFSEIIGSGVTVATEPGSLLDLDGSLHVGGTLAVGGGMQIRPHCLPNAQGCAPSVLVVDSLALAATRAASVSCFVDLSGNSGTTPSGGPVITANVAADIGGLLNVNDMSNGEPPLEGYSVPLLAATTFAGGGADFDIVRVNGEVGLPDGLYVTTVSANGVLSLEVRRGNQVAAAPSASAVIPQAPVRTVMIDDGSISGFIRLASVSSTPQGTSMLRIDRVTAEGSFVQEWGGYGLADPTDMAAGDIDGDGKLDVAISHGAPGVVAAYRQVIGPEGPSLVPMWQKQLGQGIRAECVTVLPNSGAPQSLLPTGSSVATGTSKDGAGGVTTVSSSGQTTVAAETAAVPRTIRGTDIDNDEDTDVVTGGDSSAASLAPGGATGFIQVIRRNVTGGWQSLPAVAVAGVPNAIAIGDLDGDGFKDVAASCGSISGTFPPGSRPTGVLLRGAPASGPGARPGLLRLPTAIDVGGSMTQGTGITMLDGDGDGQLDLALSWESFVDQVPSGGAAIVPIREARATGGISLGAQVQFLTGQVTRLVPCGAGSVLTFTQNGSFITGSVNVDKTDFSQAAIQGDLDGNGNVNAADVSLLLLDFGPCPGCASDLDGNGNVDSGDLSFLLLLFS